MDEKIYNSLKEKEKHKNMKYTPQSCNLIYPVHMPANLHSLQVMNHFSKIRPHKVSICAWFPSFPVKFPYS